MNALNDGDYDYSVIGPDQRVQNTPPVEALWTAAAGAQRVETRDNVSVFRLNRQLNPAACSVRLSVGNNQSSVAIGTSRLPSK